MIKQYYYDIEMIWWLLEVRRANDKITIVCKISFFKIEALDFRDELYRFFVIRLFAVPFFSHCDWLVTHSPLAALNALHGR